VIEIIAFIILGLLSGLIASTLGIGGGIVFVPSLVVFFGFEQHLAQGTSLAIIVPTAVVGTILHSKRGRVNWRVAALVAVGGVIGGVVGSTFALSIDPNLLRRLFALLLVAIALRMLSS
jgi:hypothetical protein